MPSSAGWLQTTSKTQMSKVQGASMAGGASFDVVAQQAYGIYMQIHVLQQHCQAPKQMGKDGGASRSRVWMCNW